MSPPGPLGGASKFRRWTLPLSLVLLLLFSAAAGLGSGHATVNAPTATLHAPAVKPTHLPPPAPTRSLLSSPPSLSPTPSASVSNGSFYGNYTVPSVSSSHLVCAPSPYIFLYCYPDDQDPTALLLKNGTIGLAYSHMTNSTKNTCTNATNNTVIRVAFSLSTNSGTTFGTPTLLGNETCPYIQSFEPSFGVSQSGKIFGTFVEANVTAATIFPYYYAAAMSLYTTRTSDALGFVTSTNNGTTFSNVSTITVAGGANIARPALATFGNTVYIVYENISNGSGPLAATTSPPISVNLVYSTNGGASWNGPYVLPGLNASAFNTSMSPSIAVNSTGMVAVAYATDRHCVGYCSWSSYYQAYGDEIVVATSTTNGTSWSGPNVVSASAGIGESPQYYGGYAVYRGGPGLFENSPQTSIAFDAAGTTMYVAWSGSDNRSTGDYYYDWLSSQTYSGVSSDGGVTFTTARVSPPTVNSYPPYFESAFNPAIAVSPSGKVYYTYTYYNESFSGGGCGGGTSNPLDYAYYQNIATSPNGLAWTSPSITEVTANAYADYNYLGHLASIAFNATGSPIVAYTVVNPFTFLYTGKYIYEWPTSLQVAKAWTGGSVSLTVNETNLTAGTLWGVSIDGQTFTTTSSSLTVGNVPKGTAVLIEPSLSQIPSGYRTMDVGKLSTTLPSPVFYGNSTIWLNFSLYYGISFVPDPKDLSFVELEIFNYSVVPNVFQYYYWESGPTYYYEGGSCPFPWYFPAGYKMHVSETYTYPADAYISAPVPISFWNGTGNGSYTGAGSGSSADLVVNSPFNETFWAQSYGVYNVSVNALGLPSTSTFHFAWDGTPHSGAATSAVQVSDVVTGVHRVTGVWANSSTSGWVYIGTLSNNGVVPTPDEPTVNLTFAFEDLGASAGTVSFHATGLTNGTIWHFSFNGTEYSSSTPWINITTHSGTFAEAGYPVISANGSVDYAPLSLSPTVSVTTGSTYSVSFTPAYQLTIAASTGGRVSPSTGSYWVAPSTTRSISAAPNAGYEFVGWAGTGLGSYTGTSLNASVTVHGPVIETANFAPLVANRFNLTFTDGGSLPNGTWWTVYANGIGYSSNTSTITIPNVYSCVVSGSLGRYTVNIPYAYLNSSGLTRFVPSSYGSQVCGNTVASVSFNVQYYLALEATAGGTVTATGSLQSSSVGLWASPSDLVTLQATPANGYYFLGWNGTGDGNYTGVINPEGISLSGPVTELGSFALIVIPPPPRYDVNFHLSTPFVAGTIWTVTINGTTYASSGTDLNVTGLLAHPYPLGVATAKSPDGLTLYTPVGAPSTVNVVGNQTVVLAYKTSYWVSVDVIGSGQASIQVGTSNVTSGWYASGTTITLSAYPSGTWLFSSWTGTGTGAYSGSSASDSLQVKAPLHETATFIPPVPATKVITSMWTSPTVWVGLAVGGALVGLLVGLLVGRMRRGGSNAPAGGAQ